MNATAKKTRNGQTYFVAKPQLQAFYTSEQAGGATYSDIGRASNELRLGAKTVANVLKGGRCIRKTAMRILKGCSAFGYKGSMKDSFEEI